ncbi:alpha/beta fold hydrolase [Stigmatella aurantiaca]|uniref:Hydrolase, alpha/beta fold family n=1 Tax=Stigmatella aurantiaca (strain DW4/3-1) TaxID=378806 RepID=Q09BZ4_STIAD|nr:alpha/beta hydrolase [Stigmatella aurantiaca]ADO74413.1 Hydrolase, alpha/beta fold family [Stigmatella aurantiaca DW4/3-1]EAU69325.1 lipase A [Stigmatella aurantiaca DW4/3-1]
MPPSFEPHSISAHGLALHVRQRHPAGTRAVLFLHGWLDHSRSFDWVLEHLPDTWRLILLDFRGMGRSEHVPPGGSYSFSDYLLDVECTLDGLGLETVHLVGHSLGGVVGAAYAAARPQRIQSLTLIESLGPLGGPPEAALERLRGFLDDARRPPHRKRYASVEEAAARLRENNPSLTEAASLHLARYGTEPLEGGVVFRFDPLHRRRFGLGFDEAQWLAILGALSCPVQVLHGSHGLSFEDAQTRARLAALRSPLPLTLSGGHHVHMEQPEAVARALEHFIR